MRRAYGKNPIAANHDWAIQIGAVTRRELHALVAIDFVLIAARTDDAEQSKRLVAWARHEYPRS